jgi:hypothetical protein
MLRIIAITPGTNAIKPMQGINPINKVKIPRTNAMIPRVCPELERTCSILDW